MKHTWAGPRPPIRWVHCSVCGIIMSIGAKSNREAECKGRAKITTRDTSSAGADHG